MKDAWISLVLTRISLPISLFFSLTVQLLCSTSIVVTMADMSLDPIMEKIISAGFRYLKDQVKWQTGMKEDLVKLQENLPQIQAIVHFASSQGQITDQNPALNEWLWQLRDAIDDADDVFDELEYTELEKQHPKNKKVRQVRCIMKSVKKRLVKIVKRALKIDPTLKRLEEAVQKLDKVSTYGVGTFLHLVKHAKQELQKQQLELHGARETGSLPKNDLIGRGKEKELVMAWLRNPSNEPRGTDLDRNNISLLCIVGHGGMGKTTLLQHVYKDEEITNEFVLKMWVCVSNNFDVKKVIADMFESLKKERPRLETLGALQDSLRTQIMSKKFLLVLDDIWEEDGDISKWEDVLAPLVDGGFGSKIMVTTRTDSAALMFAKVIKKKKIIVKLEGLEEDDCLLLLNSHAFAGVENPNDHENLRVIARDIVKKLSSSPLAAKVIGGVLNDNVDERHWREVLESNLLEHSSINSILRLSYIVLPNHLQNCFAICCMFPQDHEFDKDDLVRMWIALGFIQRSQGMSMEDIGGRYFDVLVKKALFDKVGDDYKMHDLIHESASKFFAQECGKLMDDEESSSKISQTIRHLSVQTTNIDITKKIGQFKHLHSLFLLYEYFDQDLCSTLIKIFKTSRRLRLLYICRIHKLKMIPKYIGYLKHLRYLNIKTVYVTRLPGSVSNLYHLQCIINEEWVSDVADDFLPSGISNLSNLRYMKLPKNCYSSICGIGKLKFLHELLEFKLRDVSGYRIGELENMNDLCKLGINCLENVKDAEEACSAKLCAKKRLTDLNLLWSNTDSRNIDLYEIVLHNLQPPKCLRNLSIYRYMGARSAIWMNNVDLIINLEKIQLTDCLEWETLPPFGQLPFLKSLALLNMPKVKCLESKFNGNGKYRAFPLLEELYISDLKALEDWFEAGVAAEDGCLFPCLIGLVLVKCPKLKELPSLPPKLKTLRINKTGWTTLNFCSNSNPIPLEFLEVIDCPNITSLPLADEIARLAALRHLTIEICPNLISLGEMPTTNNCHLMLNILSISDPLVLLMEPLRSIASLEKLEIEDNAEVVSFPNESEQWFLKVSSSLSELALYNCPKLKELPSLPPKLKTLKIKKTGWSTLNFCSNSNPIPLETLKVFDCPNITSLPLADEIARLASLRHLAIKNCPKLISLGEMPTTNNCLFMLSALTISDTSVLLMEPLRSIASLKELNIWDNDSLVSFSNEEEQWILKVSSSLSELNFTFLKSLQSLPSSLESLSSLQALHIRDVPMLRELPNLPPSLKSLSIRCCHPELKERYGEDGGSDRHKIAHIPHINIEV